MARLVALLLMLGCAAPPPKCCCDDAALMAMFNDCAKVDGGWVCPNGVQVSLD